MCEFKYGIQQVRFIRKYNKNRVVRKTRIT